MIRGVSWEERFWLLVERGEPDACWEWTLARDKDGYGSFKRNGAQVRAHRVSYELAHGDPGGLCVCHTCDNPPCVNPAHLFLGTNADNTRDKVSKGRHPVGSASPNARLTEDDVREARRLAQRGVTYTDIARRLGKSRSAVALSVRGLAWAHVPGGLPSRRVGSGHHQAKLGEGDIPDIRRRLAAGESQRSIAESYGVSRSAIGKIAYGESWTHV